MAALVPQPPTPAWPEAVLAFGQLESDFTVWLASVDRWRRAQPAALPLVPLQFCAARTATSCPCGCCPSSPSSPSGLAASSESPVGDGRTSFQGASAGGAVNSAHDHHTGHSILAAAPSTPSVTNAQAGLIICCSIIQKGPKLADKVDNSKNAWISTCFGEHSLALCSWPLRYTAQLLCQPCACAVHGTSPLVCTPLTCTHRPAAFKPCCPS